MANWESCESHRLKQCEVPSRIDEVICGNGSPTGVN